MAEIKETVTMKMRGRPVTHDEAEASAQRLINSHFHNADQARVSIPVRPDNDDVLVMDYVMEQCKAGSVNAEVLAALKATVEIAEECAREWDGDNDMRVGKILLALAGANRGYRADIDAIHDAIFKAEGGR